MLSSLPTKIIVGTLLGFLSGLGVGGGSLLMLWLTLILETDPVTARGINLLFFIPSALFSTLLRLQSRSSPDWKTVIPAAVAGSAAALIFSILGSRLNTDLLKKFFGVLLLAAGLREIFYMPKKK